MTLNLLLTQLAGAVGVVALAEAAEAGFEAGGARGIEESGVAAGQGWCC